MVRCPFYKYGICVVAPVEIADKVTHRLRCETRGYRICKFYIKNKFRDVDKRRTGELNKKIVDFIPKRNLIDVDHLVKEMLRVRREREKIMAERKIEKVIQLLKGDEGERNT